ncbi:tetratricopeptide repeat protein [Vibrio renipiscarius]|uniref:tetratricopeptide repeat protein n=1 Tax=Vibrio renipiscarius TaxID=1461322 RepID=UPI00354CE74E
MANQLKYLSYFILLALMQGCVPSQSMPKTTITELNAETQEKVLQAANNPTGLIEFYKDQLKVNESTVFRQKLALTYLANFDPESALFTIQPLLNKHDTTVESDIVASKAHMDMGSYPQAEALLLETFKKEQKSGEVANLLGIIYAEQGQLDKARAMFESARRQFYDDVKVKNNLALLDMLEGDHRSALQRLAVILPEEQVDAQLRANLMLIMAKNGQREFVFDQLEPSLTEAQSEQIYQALRESAILPLKHSEEAQIQSDDIPQPSEKVAKLGG